MSISRQLKGRARLEGETYEDYRARRDREQKMVKNYLQGELVYYPGGMRSRMMLMHAAAFGEITFEVAQQLIQQGQGTLKGKPVLDKEGNPVRDSNGNIVRKGVNIKADREAA